MAFLTTLLVLTLVTWLGARCLAYSSVTQGGAPTAIETELVLVGHAGVGLRSATYSNSLEALNAAAARGLEHVEIDLSLTTDGRIVASHDWNEIYHELRPDASILPPALASLLPSSVPHHSAFMTAPMRAELTPVDAVMLGAWLRTHPEVNLITDAKDDNLAILEALVSVPGFPEGQVIPQIYRRDELAAVQAIGFEQIIYTRYREPDVPTAEVVDFAAGNGLTVTMPGGLATRENLKAFHAAGVPTFVHTVNDPADARVLERWGVTGVYTDFLVANGS